MQNLALSHSEERGRCRQEGTRVAREAGSSRPKQANDDAGTQIMTSSAPADVYSGLEGLLLNPFCRKEGGGSEQLRSLLQFFRVEPRLQPGSLGQSHYPSQAALRTGAFPKTTAQLPPPRLYPGPKP